MVIRTRAKRKRRNSVDIMGGDRARVKGFPGRGTTGKKKGSRKKTSSRSFTRRGKPLTPKSKRLYPRKKYRAGVTRFAKYRPTLYYTGRGWSRSKSSRAMPKRKGAIRINKRRRRYVRKNPFNFARDFARIQSLIPLTGGLIIGFYGIPLFNRFLPANMLQYRNFFGLGHIALGLGIGSIRGRASTQVASGIIAMGLYDLIASNIPQLKLPQIPESNAFIAGLMAPSAETSAESEEALNGRLSINHMAGSYQVAQRPVSEVARRPLGASYYSSARPTLGASYLAPGMRTAGLAGDFGDDDPYAGCF